MTALLTALGSGVSAQKILDYLMRKAPNLAPRISQALASGLSAEKVVKFFAKDKNFEKLKAEMEQAYSMNMNSNPLVQAQTTRNQVLGTDLASSLQRNAGPILGTAAALGTSYALSRAIPAVLQAGQKAPSLATPTVPPTPPAGGAAVTPPIPPIGPTPTATPAGIQTQTPLNQQTSQPPIVSPSSVAQDVDNLPTQGISTNLQPLFEKYKGMTDIIDKLKDKNPIPAIVAYLNKFGSAQVKKIEKEAGQPIEKVVEEYLKSNPQPIAQVEAPKAEAEAKPIEKGATVATPAGVGEVKEIRGQKALVEIDGKKHKFDKDELTPTDATMPGFVPSEENLREHARDPFLGINMPGYKPKHLTHEEWLKSQENLKEAEKAIKKGKIVKAAKAKETKEKTARYEERMAPVLKEYREKEAERKKAELESIKGFDMKELDELVDYGIADAAHEIEQGLAKGHQYFTHTGQEWKAVGQSDVTEEGKEEYPKRGKAKGLSFQEVIEKYLPVQALFQRYKHLDPRISSDRFMKRLEKSIIDLLSKAS